MRLWTIQPVEVWTKLVSDKVFHCDPEKSVLISDADATLSFKEPYDWIVRQMRQRIGEEPEGVKYPIWAWHTRNWEHNNLTLDAVDTMNRGLNVYVLNLRLMTTRYC